MSNTLQPPVPTERIALLEPRPDIGWEEMGVINPGIARLPDDTIAMVYRATGEGGMGHLGFCQLDPEAQTVIPGTRSEMPWDNQSTEERQQFPDGYADPRINKVDDWYYVWATGRNDAVLARSREAFDNDFSGQYIGGRQIVAFRTKDFATVESLGLYGPEEFDKNAFLHPDPVTIADQKYWALFHRTQFSMQVALAEQIEDYVSRDFWREHMNRLQEYTFAGPISAWEGVGTADEWPGQIAGGTPPLAIDPALLGHRQEEDKQYWLTFYNASGRPRVGTYPRDRMIGAMIYSLQADPSPKTQPFEIIARSPEPLLSAEEPYELDSSAGDVVFATGAALTLDEHAVEVFYGSGDTAVSKARFALESLAGYIRQFDGNAQRL